MDVQKIEERLDVAVAGATPISAELGGLQITSMAEVFEMAKLMSISGTAIRKHLRGNPGACLAVCIQALEWKMSPFSVANKSYEVNDQIAYEAQLIIGVINARAPLQKALRYRFEGEGQDMYCVVSGLLHGEDEPLEYESPKIKDITPKNSPLWKNDPRQQLGYFSGRSWARRHCPQVILGIYTEEEMSEHPQVQVGPTVADRLPGKKRRRGSERGFSQDHVTAQLGHAPAETLGAGIQPQPERQPLETASSAPPPAAADAASGTQAAPKASGKTSKKAPETVMEKGKRLLAEACSTPEAVKDLRTSHADLLHPDELQDWDAACEARIAELMATP